MYVLDEVDTNRLPFNDTQTSQNVRSKKQKRSKSTLKNPYQKENLTNELTPSSTISSSQYHSTFENHTPLPNLNFANSVEVWNLMLKCDDTYKRDSDLFNHHTSLQPTMRATLLDWLNEVCQAYNLTRQTYYLALDFFDRFLSIQKDCPKKNLQLIGITCLFIAAKIEEIFPPKMNRFSFVCDGACSDKDISDMELVIMNTLKWELRPVTPIAWLNAFFKVYTFSDKENISKSKQQVNESFLIPDYESELFVHIAHLIDLCTLDAGSLAFSYSVIAASAFYHFTSEDVVLHCTGKTLDQLQTCVEWMVPFAIAIKNAGLDFLTDLNNEKSMIQTHTISLELLHSAQTIQADIETEKLTVLESSEASSLCPMTPSKMASMPPTPPRSTGTS
ncbi:g1/s-specific cyclin-e1-like protein [Dermatophagoides farinae]|uniref:G1/s-specific cyclin-e1-like protein n=1 Tax=Dermatophagoides farinae TaxID=6954 RepID=A0A9D4P1F0_DERFA|nr:g1/s-specific cyclin-e1-like protein [Dermatophagoides farinae]